MTDQASPPSADHSRLPVWGVFLVVVVALLAQGTVLQAGWVLDDTPAVKDNPALADGLASAPDILANGRIPGELERNAWRPVTLISLVADAELWGRSEAFGFHLTNLLLHVACAVLLLFAVLRHARGGLVALGAALCFAAHPLHTGTIAMLVGRADLLALLLSLVALRAWDAYGGRDLAWLPVAALVWFVALLSKESVLGLPLVFVVLDVARGGAMALRQRAVGYGAFVAVAVLYLYVSPGGALAAVDLPSHSVDTQLALGFAGVLRAGLRVLLPVGYRADHTDEITSTVDGAAAIAAGLALVVTVIALTAAARRRGGVLPWAWLATVALGIPAALLAPTGGVLELRFAYIVAAPLFVVGGLVLEVLAGLTRGGRPASASAATAGLVAGLAVMICLTALSRREAEAWQDDEAVHARLLRESPNHVQALVRQGRLLRRSAERLEERAAMLPAEDRDQRRNPEVVALHEERFETLARAHGWLERAIQTPKGRETAAAWRELGLVRLQLRVPDVARARVALQKARDVDPVLRARTDEEELDTSGFTQRQLDEAARTYFALGRLERMTARREDAAESFRTAARLSPDNADYLATAGLALCELKRWGEGVPLLEQALRKSTSRAERKRLQEVLDVQRGRSREIAYGLYVEGQKALADGDRRRAAELFEVATSADRRLVGAWIQAGQLRGLWFGDYARGHAYLNTAERLVKEAPSPDEETLRQIESWRKKLHEEKRKDDAGLAGGGRRR